jgi:hypothetical protein
MIEQDLDVSNLRGDSDHRRTHRSRHTGDIAMRDAIIAVSPVLLKDYLHDVIERENLSIMGTPGELPFLSFHLTNQKN